MKEGRLFILFYFACTYKIHQSRMLQIVFLVSLESSEGGGVHWLGFMVVWTCEVMFAKSCEKSVEDVNVFTLGPLAQGTLVCMKECILQVRTIQKVMCKIELVKCK
jgi:hypothetical protein